MKNLINNGAKFRVRPFALKALEGKQGYLIAECDFLISHGSCYVKTTQDRPFYANLRRYSYGGQEATQGRPFFALASYAGQAHTDK